MKPSHIAAFALWAVLATPLGAQDFEAGLAAAQAGDYATALTAIIHEASVFGAGSLFPAPSVSEE